MGDQLGHTDDDLSAVATLHDPRRRALYRYVAAQPHEVSRDEAASAAGVPRPVAAFHLDRLVEAGLLEVSYRRLSGRSGPGAGRPSKLYRRSPRPREVSLPPRDYQLAAELFANALDEPAAEQVRTNLCRLARQAGRSVGDAVGAGLGRRASRKRRLEAVEQALADHGYQPYREGEEVRMRNCPFHALADAHRDLVCGMNVALVGGVVEGVGAEGIEARFDPRPGQCCVAVGPVVVRGKPNGKRPVTKRSSDEPTTAPG